MPVGKKLSNGMYSIVHCQSCVYFIDGYDTYKCSFKHNISMKDMWLRPEPTYNRHPSEINKNCDCPWFKLSDKRPKD